MKGLIIGGGSIGGRHLNNLKTLGISPLALVEPNHERRELVSENHNINVYHTIRSGLKWGPDFVVIASPTNLHVSHALKAARAKMHFFIEKPLSYSTQRIAELCHEAEKNSLTTMVACNMRFHWGPKTVKRLLEEGAIGKIVASRIQTGSYLPRWRPWQDYRQSYSASSKSGGAILDCIHEIDLALWYFGRGRLVGGATLPASSIGLETDGLAEILLYHQSAVLSNIHLNFIQRDYRRTCQVIGTEGTIYWDFADKRVSMYNRDGELAQVWQEPKEYAVNQMYLDELSQFIHCIEIQKSTINPLAEGLESLQVALAVKKLARRKPL